MRARSQRAVFYVCSQSNHRCPPLNFLPTQWSAAYRVCQLVVLFSQCSNGQSSFDLHWQELSCDPGQNKSCAALLGVIDSL